MFTVLKIIFFKLCAEGIAGGHSYFVLNEHSVPWQIFCWIRYSASGHLDAISGSRACVQ